jgi:hypothetical protein
VDAECFADSSLALAPITFHVHAVMELSFLRLFIERARPLRQDRTKWLLITVPGGLDILLCDCPPDDGFSDEKPIRKTASRGCR